MTTATAETPTEKPAPKPGPWHDPEQYRMTIGEHLEELRTRLILALVGFVVAGAACMYFGDEVITFFCRPLLDAYNSRRINPQLYFTEMSEPFMVWLRISLICGAAAASPWILYQLWLFVAAGLYPHERKWVTKFIPFSVGLLITGMVFVYFVVLPLTLSFFLDFGIKLKSPSPTVVATTQPIPKVPAFKGDPQGAEEYSFWYNELEHKLKMVIGGKVSVIQVLPEGMLAPHITLGKYIDLVVMLLLVFGLSFQLPLVVMALVRIGIVDVEQLKGARKIVYFALLVLASAVSPGDVITVTLLMLFPLILLYELGIFMSKPPEQAADDQPAAG
jgi:sec-independent protein translocase protein TatC